jgi:hypothetical protein
MDVWKIVARSGFASTGRQAREHQPPGYTSTHRGVRKDSESMSLVHRVLQVSQPDKLWFLPTLHAAVVDRCAYSSPFTWVRQASFPQCYFSSTC